MCIISGGMDSALASWIAKNEGYVIIALHFNYQQRTQTKELECFRKIVAHLEVIKHYEIDLDFFATIGASALTDSSIAVPTGGLTSEVPITYVPFRNGIFISIATAIAEKHHAEAIFIGVVEEDSSGYPDCRKDYMTQMEKAINLGTKEQTRLVIKTPLIALSKAEIVAKSLQLGVPLQDTWSCYQNETAACGVCDSCRLRLKGFIEANAKDPIAYQKSV